MIRAVRLCRRTYADAPLSGIGALATPGRWHSSGTRIAYSATSRSLAILEILVHVVSTAYIPDDFVIVEFEVPADAVETPQDPPDRWDDTLHQPEVQCVGDQWVRSGRSLGLLVPSVVAPGESNLLINPLHSRFEEIRMQPPGPFQFDPRLFKRS